MVAFIERVNEERERVAMCLIAMIDSYRLMERYATALERKRMMANIGAIVRRYDRVTRIQRRLTAE